MQPGATLRTSTGQFIEVVDVAKWTTANQQVYNLTIADTRTYYTKIGESSALVHNAPPDECRITSSPDSPAFQSKTVYNNGKFRIDVENPVPGRAGAAQFHIQFMGRGADPKKYYYNMGDGSWVTEDGTTLSAKIVKQVPQSAINKAKILLGVR